MAAFANLFPSLPNLITLARLLLAPLAVAMIASGRHLEAFVVFIAAGASDAVDGFIARRFDLRTELGAILDPLADKALLVSIYGTLAIMGVLPPWIAILVVFRDLLIVAGVVVSWLLDNRVEIKPVWVSKFNTASQISVAAYVLGALAFGLVPIVGLTFAVWLVAASTLLSGGVYILQWIEHMDV